MARRTVFRCFHYAFARLLPFTFHGLRHTFAMTAIARGIDIYALKELMGHVNIENTLIYAKMLPSKLVSEIKKLD